MSRRLRTFKILQKKTLEIVTQKTRFYHFKMRIGNFQEVMGLMLVDEQMCLKIESMTK